MRTFVFIRTDLSDPQKVVQASHLAMESGYHFGKPKDGHPSIIVLGVNRNEFDYVKNYLSKKGIRFVDFYENNIEDLTGIATEPLDEKTGKYLQHFKLLKQKFFGLQVSEDQLLTACQDAFEWAEDGDFKTGSNYWVTMFSDKIKEKLNLVVKND